RLRMRVREVLGTPSMAIVGSVELETAPLSFADRRQGVSSNTNLLLFRNCIGKADQEDLSTEARQAETRLVGNLVEMLRELNPLSVYGTFKKFAEGVARRENGDRGWRFEF